MTAVAALRPTNARRAGVLVAIAFLLTGCFASESQTGLNEMNADRSANGLRATAHHSMLQAKADGWAQRLARENRLYHSTLTDGIPSSTCWRGLGENVGYGDSIAGIEDAYMASPPHRANILNAGFNRAAVGVAHNGNRVFTVQVFMKTC